LTDVLIAKNSLTVHEPVLRFLSVAASGDAASCLRASPSGFRRVSRVVVTLPTVCGTGCLDICPQHTQVERPLDPEGTRERSAAFGKV